MNVRDQNHTARNYRSLNRDMAGWFIAVGIGILSIILEVVFRNNWLAILAAWAFVIQLGGLVVQYLVMQLLEGSIRKREARGDEDRETRAVAGREERRRPRPPIVELAEAGQPAEFPLREVEAGRPNPAVAKATEGDTPRREATPQPRPVARDAEPQRRTTGGEEQPGDDDLQRRAADAIKAALGADR